MPCYSIQLNKVDLNLADREILSDALEALGAVNIKVVGKDVYFTLGGRSYQIANGKLVGYDDKIGKVADAIKQSYSRTAIQRASNKFGFQLKTVGENKFVAVKKF